MVENILQSLNVYITIYLCQISGELDTLRAGLYTVAAVAAAGDTALGHESIKAVCLVVLTKGVDVVHICLRNRRRSDEV